MLHTILDNLFVLLFLVALGFLISLKQWPEWLRRIRAAHWPTTRGTIESGSVSTVRSRSHYFERGLESATASIAYSYCLDGNYYSGYHSKSFNDEQNAWSYVDGLRGTVVDVSYNPRKPETSVLKSPPVPSVPR